MAPQPQKPSTHTLTQQLIKTTFSMNTLVFSQETERQEQMTQKQKEEAGIKNEKLYKEIKLIS